MRYLTGAAAEWVRQDKQHHELHHAETSRFVLVGPDGTRLEDLDLDQVLAILRRLTPGSTLRISPM